uniref:Uncharacterized protein n=1 Tax=Salix viminalis TaxID=40686 RepID=A0A6N2LMQ5_SALVM
MTKPMKVKAFLIACILLATVVFSPLPTCTARELGGPGGYKPLPNKPPFNCGRGNRYCVRPAPKQRCSSLYKHPLENGTFWSRSSEAFLIACILLATVVFSPLSTCTARELAEKKGSVGGYGSLDPGKVPFQCGQGQRYCVPKPPKKPCSNRYSRDCAPP